MEIAQINKIINAIKNDTNLNSIFGARIVYSHFFNDDEVNEIGLLIQPISSVYLDCRNRDIIQFQIIDGKIGKTPSQIKEIMEKIENFLNSFLKSLDGFQTLAIHDNGDEVLLKNNKERLTMSKRFIFYYF